MALTRQLRRHRPDNGLTLSQLEVLGEVSRAGVTTPAELAARLQVRVQSLTDSINELEARGLIVAPSRRRRPAPPADRADRRRASRCSMRDRAERDAWLYATMRDNLTELEFNLLMLIAPVLRKLADADAQRAQSSARDARRNGSPTTPTR